MKTATDIQELSARIEALEALVSQLDEQLKAKDEQLKASEALSEQRRILILELERQTYGRRSEKRLPAPEPEGQLSLPFDDGTLVTLEEEEEAAGAAAEITRAAAERRRREQEKEKAAAGSAPRKRRVYRLPADIRVETRKIYPEGYDPEKHDVIGFEVKEHLCMRAASFYVQQDLYAAIRPKEDRQSPSPRITKAAPESDILPGCYASAGLVSQIVVDKFLNHKPEYRQCQDFKSQGVDLPTSTVNHWVHSLANEVYPLYTVLTERVLSTGYVQVDETVSNIKDTRGHVRKAYTWAIRDASPRRLGIVFAYQEGSRARHVIEDLLKDFRGALQSDGYAAYSIYEEKAGVVPLCCMAHVRRKFEHAAETDPRADHALDQIALLYSLEANLRERHATPEEIRQARQAQAYPILRSLEAWMKREYARSTPKSPLAKAISYAHGVWIRVARYVLDGHYEIDNNAIERRIRPLTLGRKNYLFSGNDKGAEDNAIFYSLIGTCLEAGVDPRKWLADTLSHLRRDMRKDELLKLLPKKPAES